MMRMLFGRGGTRIKGDEVGVISPADPVAAVNLADAIQKNKEAIDTLEKRHQHIERKIRAQECSARERVATGDRRGALLCLRRKKLFEQDLEQLMTSRLTLETQIVTLEAAHTQQLAVQAMAGAAKAHKSFSQKLSIGKIDRLLDDIQEQQDLQQEVTQVLAQGLPPLDDEELHRELDQLEASEMETRVLQTACTAPSVPADEPVLLTPSPFQHVSSVGCLPQRSPDQESQPTFATLPVQVVSLKQSLSSTPHPGLHEADPRKNVASPSFNTPPLLVASPGNASTSSANTGKKAPGTQRAFLRASSSLDFPTHTTSFRAGMNQVDTPAKLAAVENTPVGISDSAAGTLRTPRTTGMSIQPGGASGGARGNYQNSYKTSEKLQANVVGNGSYMLTSPSGTTTGPHQLSDEEQLRVLMGQLAH
ncbi:snf7 family protein [Cystoisospora suis]|uniref:Snf7 family protein n=1 Tax=Cystoisospora suis TaxID=483139 RepID=A0A2C6KS34_9APIC|nr:snf7 family protein [Cystoisospora suis]